MPPSSRHFAVRTGYRYVRGLSDRVKERLDATAPFTSFEDFVSRARVPRDAVARIACADAFASTGLSRRAALWMALRLPPDEEEVFPDGGHGERPGEIRFPDLHRHDAMLADYDAVGFSTHAHPVSFLREDFVRRRVLDSRALAKMRNRSRVKIGGMAIVRQRPPTAGNVVFVTLEDEWGFLNLVVRPEIYDAYRPLCRDALFVVCEGTVERSGGAINVQAECFEPAVPDDATADANAKGAIGVPHGHPRHLDERGFRANRGEPRGEAEGPTEGRIVRESPVAHQASTPAPTDPRNGGDVPNVKSRDFR